MRKVGNYQPPIDDSPVAYFLRAARQKANLTTRAVAKMTGVSTAYINRLERGHCLAPIPEHAITLGKFYNVDPAVLMGLRPVPCHTHTFRMHLSAGAKVMYGCMCGAWYVKNIATEEIILKSENA